MKPIALAVLSIAITSAAHAHEIGTTQVHALFRKDHTYSIDVITAPQALANKIETQRHLPRSSALTARQLQDRLQTFAPQLAEAASIRFGTVAASPRVTVLPIVAPADAQ